MDNFKNWPTGGITEGSHHMMVGVSDGGKSMVASILESQGAIVHKSTPKPGTVILEIELPDEPDDGPGVLFNKMLDLLEAGIPEFKNRISARSSWKV